MCSMRRLCSSRLTQVPVGQFTIRLILLLFLSQLFPASSCSAVETWADPNLSIVDGLELWLDAGRLGEHTSVPSEGPINEWPDASGKRRHVKQVEAGAQPSLVKIGS